MSLLQIPSEELQVLYLDLIRRRLEAIEMIAKIEEPELILLKGHLLIEEVLFAMLEYKMKKASSLAKARLSFAQIVSLVEGLYAGEDLNQSWLYAASHQLNKIRNRLAHNIRPDGLGSEVNDFIEFVFKNLAPDFSPKNPLQYAVGGIHANFSALLTLHKKVALVPSSLKGFSFETMLTLSKILSRDDISTA